MRQKFIIIPNHENIPIMIIVKERNKKCHKTAFEINHLQRFRLHTSNIPKFMNMQTISLESFHIKNIRVRAHKYDLTVWKVQVHSNKIFSYHLTN